MKIKDFVPSFLIKYIRILQLKRKYSQSEIHSNLIANNVNLGNKTKIGPSVILKNRVEIGMYSYLNDNTVVGENTKIGKYCSIAYNCQIGMNEHPTHLLSTSPKLYGKDNLLGINNSWKEFSKETKIENDVWVGSNAIILQGVTVHNGSVIAAGAVVTKDVPPYSIVAGVPAKVIKYRFDKETIAFLIKTCWWEMTPAQILKNERLKKLL